MRAVLYLSPMYVRVGGNSQLKDSLTRVWQPSLLQHASAPSNAEKVQSPTALIGGLDCT